MAKKVKSITERKKEHLQLCLTDDVAFKNKTTGFERYEFKHYAITEVKLKDIDLTADFFGKKIGYPFLISCMTGGTSAAENINARLSEAAAELNIPLGVGSQRQALEDKRYLESYKVIRSKAPKIPVIGNIGAAQLVRFKFFDDVKYLTDLIKADAMAIHVNPLQELVQDRGEPDFKGLLRSLEKLVKELDVPLIVKEVGAGISKEAAKRLLSAGVQGIDIAGAGGTSWAGVEILRNNDDSYKDFWDWGLPTAYCLRSVSKLKKKFKFTLIGSGGINDAFSAAKALALGADITASARIILQQLEKSGTEGVVHLIKNWFDTVRNIMFLTGSNSLDDLKNKKIIRKEKLI